MKRNTLSDFCTPPMLPSDLGRESMAGAKMTQSWSLQPKSVEAIAPAPGVVSLNGMEDVAPALRWPSCGRRTRRHGRRSPTRGPNGFGPQGDRRRELLHSCRRRQRGVRLPVTNPVASAPAPPESGGELVRLPSSVEEGRRTSAGVVLNWKRRNSGRRAPTAATGLSACWPGASAGELPRPTAGQTPLRCDVSGLTTLCFR